jgi:hypothetical protein
MPFSLEAAGSTPPAVQGDPSLPLQAVVVLPSAAVNSDPLSFLHAALLFVSSLLVTLTPLAPGPPGAPFSPLAPAGPCRTRLAFQRGEYFGADLFCRGDQVFLRRIGATAHREHQRKCHRDVCVGEALSYPREHQISLHPLQMSSSLVWLMFVVFVG